MLLATAASNSVEPGTLGFLVVAGMGLILVFLFRSMSKHLRKVSGGTGQGGPPGPERPASGNDWLQASVALDDPASGGTKSGNGGGPSGPEEPGTLS